MRPARYNPTGHRWGKKDKHGMTDWDRKNEKCLKEHGMSLTEWKNKQSMANNERDEAQMARWRAELGPERPVLQDD